MLSKIFESVVCLFEGTDEQGVPADAKLRTAVEITAHVLELAARNPRNADDPDALVRFEGIGEFANLFALPFGKVLGLAFCLCGAHLGHLHGRTHRGFDVDRIDVERSLLKVAVQPT